MQLAIERGIGWFVKHLGDACHQLRVIGQKGGADQIEWRIGVHRKPIAKARPALGAKRAAHAIRAGVEQELHEARHRLIVGCEHSAVTQTQVLGPWADDDCIGPGRAAIGHWKDWNRRHRWDGAAAVLRVA